MRRSFVLLLILAALPAAASRLPRGVIPNHYTLRVEPDLAHETFRGDVTIDLDVHEPTSSIVLHSIGLQLSSINAGAARGTVASVDPVAETVTIALDRTLPKGAAALHIAFSGALSIQLHGLYLSRTEKRKYAVSQFEATDARRAFPCFDEPDLKATFDVTLVVDDGDTAISNSPIASDTPAENHHHAIRFATTPRLSTYLVAMLVGDFRCSEGSADGIPIRVCATPGKETLTRFALSAAITEVKFYNDYFGIRYPFAKLDAIAVPDFEAGAMENAGAIVFRETSLLVDEARSSYERRNRVAETMAHEIAHMWFGDLVTMQWWNDIWLNEGFATFMTRKPVAAWKPEWYVALDDVTNTVTSLALDSQRATRAIRTNAETPAEINELFDGIAYGKTAAVLRMVENWIGKTAFRDGIRAYMKKYAWGNAAAEDFWSTMAATTGKPVDAVMRSFVEQPGVPLLHVSESCDAKAEQVQLTQERLVPKVLASAAPPAPWSLPVCTRALKSNDVQCSLVSAPAQTLARGACATTLANAGALGYYVTDYSPELRAELRRNIKALTADERISLHGDTWLLVKSARLPVDEYLQLAAALPRPFDRVLAVQLSANLVWLSDTVVTPAMRPAWNRTVQRLVRGLAPPVWTTPPNAVDADRVVRAEVLWALGHAAEDQDVLRTARQYAEAYLANPNQGDAVLADRALALTAANGDERFYDKLVAAIDKAPTPELRNRYLFALTAVRDPKLIARTIDYTFTTVRAQDLPQVLAALIKNPASRAAAWTAAQAKWATLQHRIPNALHGIVSATGSFCDDEAHANVERFFAAHPTPEAARALGRALESIQTCAAFTNAQSAALTQALAAR
jgi:aminopeptidase N